MQFIELLNIQFFWKENYTFLQLDVLLLITNKTTRLIKYCEARNAWQICNILFQEPKFNSITTKQEPFYIHC